jgi:hypothetical protein
LDNVPEHKKTAHTQVKIYWSMTMSGSKGLGKGRFVRRVVAAFIVE